MNSKEEKIKEAYGNFSDVAMEICDENGWIKLGEYYTYFPRDREESLCGRFIRPKSLQGIENNNGWIKIESEDDLPKDYDSLYDVCNDQNVDTIPMTLHQVKYLYDNKKITHYQNHEKKLPPLY